MKRALLVGINKYQLPGNELHGCVNDINSVRTLLIDHYGYLTNDIHVLADAAATKAAIITQLKSMIESKANRMVFYYSGHGTKFWDAAHNVNDEALCPVDTKNENTLISGTELGLILAKIPPSCTLQFVADCCHSGTIDRDFSMTSSFGKSKDKLMTVPGLTCPKGLVMPKTLTKGDHLLLSGCRADQTSADAWFENTPHGALTYALLQVLKGDPKISWRKMHVAAQQWLVKNKFQQVPQLSGSETITNLQVFS